MGIKYSKNLIKAMAGVVAITLMAVASKASAATQTFSGTISSLDTNWGPLTINLTKFDTGLGTLTSVEIFLSGSATTLITVTNNGTSSSTGNVETQVKFKLSDAGGFIGTSTKVTLNLPSDPESDASYSLSAGDSVVLGSFADEGLYNQSFTNGALAEFSTAGAGTIALVASATANTLLANTGGNTSAEQATTASSIATVVYHYDAIPEPGTYALLALGLGLGGVVYLRNRRPAVKA